MGKKRNTLWCFCFVFFFRISTNCSKRNGNLATTAAHARLATHKVSLFLRGGPPRQSRPAISVDATAAAHCFSRSPRELLDARYCQHHATIFPSRFRVTVVAALDQPWRHPEAHRVSAVRISTGGTTGAETFIPVCPRGSVVPRIHATQHENKNQPISPFLPASRLFSRTCQSS